MVDLKRLGTKSTPGLNAGERGPSLPGGPVCGNVTRAATVQVVPDLSEFAYLWTTQRDHWVVLRTAPDESGLPFNRFTRQALLIDEDDALAEAVVQRMISEGLSVITSAPE